MVEFVLVAGLLFLIFFSIVDFGLALNARLVVTTAAREGARRAAIEGGATEGAYGKIKEQLALGRIDPSQASITITPRTATYGTTITVTVSYPYKVISPVVQAITGPELLLKAEILARSEKIK